MASFNELLGAPAERLVNIFYRVAPVEAEDRQKRIRLVARQLGITSARLVNALGFNPAIRELHEILSVLGFDSCEQLISQRNAIFLEDIYKQLTLDDVLAIYVHIRHHPEILDVMQYLLARRLNNIEKRIDATVSSLTIERYKKEMRAIYAEGVARIEFAEERLANTDSGFRALVNEVSIIVESKLIPVGDIFFRDTVLPEEKRKLIVRGYIPRQIIETRLEDEHISPQERRMLQEQLRLMQ